MGQMYPPQEENHPNPSFPVGSAESSCEDSRTYGVARDYADPYSNYRRSKGTVATTIRSMWLKAAYTPQN